MTLITVLCLGQSDMALGMWDDRVISLSLSYRNDDQKQLKSAQNKDQYSFITLWLVDVYNLDPQSHDSPISPPGSQPDQPENPAKHHADHRMYNCPVSLASWTIAQHIKVSRG